MELSTNTSLADLVGPSSSGTFLALTGSGILFEITVLKAIVLIAGSIQTKGSLEYVTTIILLLLTFFGEMGQDNT